MSSFVSSFFKNKPVLIFAAVASSILLGSLVVQNMLVADPIAQPPVQPPQQTVSATSVPTRVLPTVPAGSHLVISGITVNNFYKNARDMNTASDVLIFENDKFSISYVAEFEHFYIVLNGPDFTATRAEAEREFLELLGIQRVQACRLNVEESVPLQSDSLYAGGVYNLSFCETAP